jgi:hypothetical protein
LSLHELIDAFNTKGHTNIYIIPKHSIRGFREGELMTLRGFDDEQKNFIVFRHGTGAVIPVSVEDLKDYKIIC